MLNATFNNSLTNVYCGHLSNKRKLNQSYYVNERRHSFMDDLKIFMNTFQSFDLRIKSLWKFWDQYGWHIAPIAIPTNLPWLHSSLLLILNFLSFYSKIYMFVSPLNQWMCLLTIRKVKMLPTISTRVWSYPSQVWLFCIGPVVFLPQKMFILFDFERTWWWLFQKRIVRSKLYIYVFVKHDIIVQRKIDLRLTNKKGHAS